MRGDLRLNAPSGRTVRLFAEGPRLRLVVPNWQDLVVIGPQSLAGRRRVMVSAARRLALLGLSLDIVLQGRQLLSVGDKVKPTWLSRVLGLGSVHLPVSALLTVWRQSAQQPHSHE